MIGLNSRTIWQGTGVLNFGNDQEKCHRNQYRIQENFDGTNFPAEQPSDDWQVPSISLSQVYLVALF